MTYQKVQVGWGMTLVLTVIIILIIVSYQFQLGNNPITTGGFIGIGTILLLTLLCFYKLTVVVKDKRIILKLGIGIIRINMKPENITEIRTVKIPFYYGFGIRMTGNGMLYNVQGSKGVRICYGRNKQVTIGSEEPAALQEAIVKEFGDEKLGYSLK